MPFIFPKRLLAALLLCILPTMALAGPIVEIDAPDTVGRGKPFLVHIGSWYPLEDLRVQWNGKIVRPSVTRVKDRTDADLLLGVDLRGQTGSHTIYVTANIWGKEKFYSKTINVVESTWGKESLRVAPKMVKPPAEVMDRIKRERKQLRAAINTFSHERHWEIPFARPAKGKMLSRFGLHRVFNGDTKSRHTGLDFRAWLGTPLYAMSKGRVVLTGSFYYAGNAVIIDHGNGLVSLSAHMSKTLVKEGDMVEAGQKIGLSGATGRVNGAHLHLGVFVMGETIDPELFFDGTFEKE